MTRFLCFIQQITLNERGLVALCLGLILLACFIEKRPINSQPLKTQPSDL
ncbi:MAG: hypothetical protein HFP77_04365 [Methylococcales symbiont of Iophon sp. n. MRB-2018]|nr:MAG: hypothetical protein HFP77_04365 [Methylococcales symbiont of Iophon sp. n. MRB-2018]